ncbi:MAG: hypothetical protein AAGD38_18060, partial [Acidobacteriota bacterium]
LERGWVTGEQLMRAVQAQDSVGGRIGTHLLEMGVLDEATLLAVLAEQLGVSAVGVKALDGIPSAVVEMIPAPVASRCLSVPFAADEHTIDVATPNVHNLDHLDEIAFCSNRRVRPHVANEVRVHEALARYWSIPLPERFSLLLARLDGSRYVWNGSETTAEAASSMASSTSAAPRDTSLSDDDRDILATRDDHVVTVATRPASHELGLTGLEQRLRGVTSSATIGNLLLQYLMQSFSRAALFKIQRQQVVGWLTRGNTVDDAHFGDFALSLDEASVFADLAGGSQLHVGPLPATPPHLTLATCWGGTLPAESVLMPVRLGDKLVSVLYGDRGDQGLAGLNVERFDRLRGIAAAAFERAIRARRADSGAHRAPR